MGHLMVYERDRHYFIELMYRLTVSAIQRTIGSGRTRAIGCRESDQKTSGDVLDIPV